jgi:hypothetical protein
MGPGDIVSSSATHVDVTADASQPGMARPRRGRGFSAMTTPAPASNKRSAVEACAFTKRAMLIWPRLDRRTLARCGCDLRRIAAYVARRTSLSVDAIAALLEESVRAESEPSFYFG